METNNHLCVLVLSFSVVGVNNEGGIGWGSLIDSLKIGIDESLPDKHYPIEVS